MRLAVSIGILLSICVSAVSSYAEDRSDIEESGNQIDSASIAVKSVVDCQLVVNGEDVGPLTAGQTLVVKVIAGDQLVECRGTNGGASQAITTVESGKQAIVKLSAPPRFAKRGMEMVDTLLGLYWQARPSSVDIIWSEAHRYCAQQHNGWRLPTSNELAPLLKSHVPLPDLDNWFWTNDRAPALDGSTDAWHIFLMAGLRGSGNPDRTARVLCVRRP